MDINEMRGPLDKDDSAADCVSATENPVAWVRGALAASNELKFNVGGNGPWIASRTDLAVPVITTVKLENGFVEIEACALIDVNTDNVAQLRLYQMLVQQNYRIRCLQRAEAGRPFTALCRHAVTDGLDLRLLVDVTFSMANENLDAALEICSGGASAQELWERSHKAMLNAALIRARISNQSDK